MAVSFQASKFALLPDDDEDLNKKALRALKNAKTDNGKVENNKPKSKAKKKNKKNKPEATAVSDGQESKKSTPAKEVPANNKEFETWLSHDKQVNDQAFAQDLQKAILASKIDAAAPRQKSPPGMTMTTNKGKPAAMSLQDFNNLSLKNGVFVPPAVVPDNPPFSVPETENGFFEDVEEATKKALNREQIKESLEQRYNHLPDQALLKQYRSILDGKEAEIVKLTDDKQTLTLEVEKVKKRYKIFRDLLEQVECREKAEVLSENMKLKKVQGEISEELDFLREENEKLKTKLATFERMKILSDQLKERKAQAEQK